MVDGPQYTCETHTTGIHMFVELLSRPIRPHIAACTEMRDSDKDLLEAEVGRDISHIFEADPGIPWEDCMTWFN